MTSAVVRFPKGAKRGWVVIETAPGSWHGELRERGHRGALRWTETASLRIVRAAIHTEHDGLPVFERPLAGRRSA